ncbi:endo- -beta-glucanase [Brettanomyces bruxellensis AWRI1499]|nr:endo- -beta-glucanase [Brettanomyces bruxellensis AWRI1499]
MTAQTSGTIFSAVSTAAPSSSYKRLASTVSIPSGVSTSAPIQTNNFWGNLTLGSQNSYVYTHPYVEWVSKDTNFEGLAISHQDASQRVLGATNSEGASSYFYMAAGNKCMVLGSSDF